MNYNTATKSKLSWVRTSSGCLIPRCFKILSKRTYKIRLAIGARTWAIMPILLFLKAYHLCHRVYYPTSFYYRISADVVLWSFEYYFCWCFRREDAAGTFSYPTHQRCCCCSMNEWNHKAESLYTGHGKWRCRYSNLYRVPAPTFEKACSLRQKYALTTHLFSASSEFYCNRKRNNSKLGSNGWIPGRIGSVCEGSQWSYIVFIVGNSRRSLHVLACMLWTFKE